MLFLLSSREIVQAKNGREGSEKLHYLLISDDSPNRLMDGGTTFCYYCSYEVRDKHLAVNACVTLLGEVSGVGKIQCLLMLPHLHPFDVLVAQYRKDRASVSE